MMHSLYLNKYKKRIIFKLIIIVFFSVFVNIIYFSPVKTSITAALILRYTIKKYEVYLNLKEYIKNLNEDVIVLKSQRGLKFNFVGESYIKGVKMLPIDNSVKTVSISGVFTICTLRLPFENQSKYFTKTIFVKMKEEKKSKSTITKKIKMLQLIYNGNVIMDQKDDLRYYEKYLYTQKYRKRNIFYLNVEDYDV